MRMRTGGCTCLLHGRACLVSSLVQFTVGHCSVTDTVSSALSHPMAKEFTVCVCLCVHLCNRCPAKTRRLISAPL